MAVRRLGVRVEQGMKQIRHLLLDSLNSLLDRLNTAAVRELELPALDVQNVDAGLAYLVSENRQLRRVVYHRVGLCDFHQHVDRELQCPLFRNRRGVQRAEDVVRVACAVPDRKEVRNRLCVPVLIEAIELRLVVIDKADDSGQEIV